MKCQLTASAEVSWQQQEEPCRFQTSDVIERHGN